jgi:hypothetical protein
MALVLMSLLFENRGRVFCRERACLIVDDELGGAFGRVCCIGAKQWVPEDGSKIKGWLAQRSLRM